jgi:hypothetical protein
VSVDDGLNHHQHQLLVGLGGSDDGGLLLPEAELEDKAMKIVLSFFLLSAIDLTS